MAKRLRVLAVSLVPAFELPGGEGEVRLAFLYRHLSGHCDVTLVTAAEPGAQFERKERSPGFTELRFPEDELWRQAYASLQGQRLSGDLAGLAFALAVADPQCALRLEVRRLATEVDVVIHDSPFSEPIFADGCPVPEFYNAQNVELVRFSSIVRGPGAAAGFLECLRIEGALLARAQKTFAPRQTDLEIFRLFYGVAPAKLALCSNGFDESHYERLDALRSEALEAADPRPRLLFMGSSHPTDVEAAEFLLQFASSMPESNFVMAGEVCLALTTRFRPANVILEGPFDPQRKLELLASADLFLNPIIGDLDAHSKSLEAIVAGLPIVATPVGVRELDFDPDGHAIVVPRHRMAETVRELLKDAHSRQAMADAGRGGARARYGWSQIARDLAAELKLRQAAASPAAPLVLAFNDYAIDGLLSGGAERIRGLLGSLDRDVVLATYGEAFKISLVDRGFLCVSMAKSEGQQAFERAFCKGRTLSANDAIAAFYAGFDRSLMEVVSPLLSRAAVAVFEHPYMAPLMDSIRARRPHLPIIYSAHNCEAELKRDLFRGDAIGPIVVSFVERLEDELLRCADLVVACTQDDAGKFSQQNRNVALAENGCVVPQGNPSRSAREAGPFRAGFLGSGHPPNIEAAQFILRALAPRFAEARFEFVGGVCEGLVGHRLKNVVLHGAVSVAAKTEILSHWDLALNPLASGGGSSLKLPDYMAHGLATLNTPVGARGAPVAELGLGEVVERDDFAFAFAGLMSDRVELRAMGARARAFAVDRLSWRSVASDYRRRIAALA